MGQVILAKIQPIDFDQFAIPWVYLLYQRLRERSIMKDKVNDSLQESVNLALEAMRLEVGDKFSLSKVNEKDF